MPHLDAPLTHERFEAAAGATSLGIGAGELHGLLTGYLCGGGRAEGHDLLRALDLVAEDAPAEGPLAELMVQARPWCSEQLDGMHLGFQPLLPPDTRPLAERADAMVEWTRGFLGGFGLAGAGTVVLSADGREVLHDRGVIAAAPLAGDDADDAADDEDEGALMELVEFVRVGAMLLRTEVAAANRDGGAPS